MSKFIEVKEITIPDGVSYLTGTAFPGDGLYLVQATGIRDQLVYVGNNVGWAVGSPGGSIRAHLIEESSSPTPAPQPGVVTEAFALRLLTAAIGNTPEQLEKLLA